MSQGAVPSRYGASHGQSWDRLTGWAATLEGIVGGGPRPIRHASPLSTAAEDAEQREVDHDQREHDRKGGEPLTFLAHSRVLRHVDEVEVDEEIHDGDEEVQ